MDNYVLGDEPLLPSYNGQLQQNTLTINNGDGATTALTSTFGTAISGQMSTFKSSPAPTSANSFSSGYNSYSGSGIAISITGNNNGNNLSDNTNLSECSSGGQSHFQLSGGSTNEGYISGSPIFSGHNQGTNASVATSNTLDLRRINNQITAPPILKLLSSNTNICEKNNNDYNFKSANRKCSTNSAELILTTQENKYCLTQSSLNIQR